MPIPKGKTKAWRGNMKLKHDQHTTQQTLNSEVLRAATEVYNEII